MPYKTLVKESLKIMWKYKYLWLLGLLVNLGEGIGHTFTNFKGKSNAVANFLAQPEILFPFILFWFILLITLTILNFTAQGGLIHCVNKINRNESASLGDGWRAGVKNFWGLLGIGILILFAIIAVLAVCALPVIGAFLIHKSLGMLSLLLFIPLFLLAIIIINFVYAYAVRVRVIEKRGVIDSLKEGRSVFKNNFRQSIAVAIISFVSNIIYEILFILIGLGLVMNFFLAWAFADLLLAVIAGMLIALAYVVITKGIFDTYLSAFWTLAYLEIKRLGQKPAIPLT
jgi:hypothetical protein